jgi:L-malate glycosyltransferase
MKNPMHVLVVAGEYNTPTESVGGAFIYPQLKALVDAGFKVGVLYPDLRGVMKSELRRFAFPMWTRNFEGILELGVEGLSIPKSHNLNRKWWDINALRLARRYVEREGPPDIVHAHFSCVAGPAASKVARQCGVPLFVTEHYTAFITGAVLPFDRRRAIDTFAHATVVLAVGGRLATAIQPLSATPVRILPNTVHSDFFQTAIEPPSDTTFKCVAVGGLRPIKGFDLLLRAFSKAFPNPNDAVRLRVCGEGAERGNLQKLIKALGLESQVVLLGSCSRMRICRELEDCNVFISSSWTETFGVSVTEALAAGRPVVATRSGGPEDTVGDHGLLCPPGDVGALATCLRQVCADRERWASRAPIIREQARTRFAPEVFAHRLRDIYDGALAARTGPR